MGLATVDLGPLRRHRDFRLLFIGRLVSFFGSMITFVAAPYQLYQLTHSTLAIGLVGLVELAGLLGFAFLGGAFADARDRRLMVLLSEVALMTASAALLVNSLLPHPAVWVLFAVAAAAAAAEAIQRPSLDAMLPRLVDPGEITSAGALSQLRGTVGMVAGPALAGLLVASAGLPLTYGIDVATFGVSLVCLWLMRAVPPPVGAERPSLRRIGEGLRYARGRPDLIGTYLVDAVAMFFGMPLALFPAIAEGLGGASVLGLLFAAPAAGSLLVAATSGWTARVHRHGAAIVVAAGLWGLAVVAFGFAGSLPVALACLALAGAADSVSGIFRQAIWNHTIPDSLRGRLAAIELVSYSGGPSLGNFEAGAVASVWSLRGSIVSGGVLCVLGCVACAVALPAFWGYDDRARPPAG